MRPHLTCDMASTSFFFFPSLISGSLNSLLSMMSPWKLIWSPSPSFLHKISYLTMEADLDPPLNILRLWVRTRADNKPVVPAYTVWDIDIDIKHKTVLYLILRNLHQSMSGEALNCTFHCCHDGEINKIYNLNSLQSKPCNKVLGLLITNNDWQKRQTWSHYLLY